MAIHRKPLPKIIGALSEGFWWQCPECDARGKQYPTYRDAFHDPDKFTHNCQRLTSSRDTCPVCQQDIELDILGRFADQIGRASCRERVQLAVGAVEVKNGKALERRGQVQNKDTCEREHED